MRDGKMTKIAALLTDFGTVDSYVGALKAVMLGIEPALQIVDISHAIQPQNIRQAAIALLTSYRYFPKSAVFCAVVDPGVGSARQPIAVRCAGYFFVAPDNGLLSYVLQDLAGSYQAVALENEQYQLPAVSHTFHGRDIFAPAAAHVARDPASLLRMGPKLDKIATMPPPRLSFAGCDLIGEVTRVDHFGNIITSIGDLRWTGADALCFAARWHDELPPLRFSASSALVEIRGQGIRGISRAYHEAPRGGMLALIDSSGFLEIGANQANAAALLKAELGDQVRLRLSAED